MMETKRIPNVFVILYRMARRDDYDVTKWRDILTGIHRKSGEKHSIRDICLLYYSLFKGHTTKTISNLEITYRDRETGKDCGPITIGDIAEAYDSKVSEFLKFMNSKQIAMISKYLLMMNKLDKYFCDLILSRIGSNHLKISPRSFSNIVLSLSESKFVSSDRIERLLLENKDLLGTMNRLDLMYVLKSISIHNISNPSLSSLISDKMEFYIEDMNSDEILNTFESVYRMDWNNEKLLTKLYFRTQSLLEKFPPSSLVFISKYLSHFDLKDIKDFFDLQLIPLVHKLHERSQPNVTEKQNFTQKLSGKNLNDTGLLLFYNYCFSSGSITFPKLLFNLLDSIDQDHQWNLLFSVLNKYRKNIGYTPSKVNEFLNSSLYTSLKREFGNFSEEFGGVDDSENFVNLLSKSITSFTNFVYNNELEPRHLASIIRVIVELGVTQESLFLQILEKIANTQKFPVDFLVDILFSLHTLNTENHNNIYENLLKGLLEDKKILDYSYAVHLLTIMFFRNLEIPKDFLSILKSIFGSHTEQQNSWEISNLNTSNNFSAYKRGVIDISDDDLEYFVYSMAFPNSINTKKQAFVQFKEELLGAFKKIKNFKKHSLLQPFFYYIGEFDKELQKTLLDSKSLYQNLLEFEIIELDTVPTFLSGKFEKLDYLLVKSGDEVFFGVYLVSGTKDAYYSEVSLEKWDCITENAVKSILSLNNYNTHKIKFVN